MLQKLLQPLLLNQKPWSATPHAFHAGEVVGRIARVERDDLPISLG